MPVLFSYTGFYMRVTLAFNGLNFFYHWFSNVMNEFYEFKHSQNHDYDLNDPVAAAWKRTFLRDITWNLAVFCWLIYIYTLYTYWISILKSSRPEAFYKKGVLRNFVKFTGKQLCQGLYLNFIKKETLAQLFSCEYCEISKNTFFHRTPLVAASVYSAVLQLFT